MAYFETFFVAGHVAIISITLSVGVDNDLEHGT